MKKKVVLISCIILGLLTMGCSNDIKTNSDQKEITILVKDYERSHMGIGDTIKIYIERFERENGVKVNFDVINGNNDDDYDKKINTKLYLKEGPTLIFISLYGTYQNYIKQEIAVKNEGEIPNITKVYDSLLDEGYGFVPVGMIHWAVALNRPTFDKLEIDAPKLNWTREDYINIKEKWLKIEPQYLHNWIYQEYLALLDDLDIFDESKKKVNLCNDKVIQYINYVREEIFSGKYIMNKDYTYENYFNMLFNEKSVEHIESRDLELKKENVLRKYWYVQRGLKSIETSEYININDDIVLPRIMDGEDALLYTCGFIVNRNGKNIELGRKFLNGLLSDEIQLEMYQKKFDLYPVNKDIESEIEKIEKEKNINEKAVNLRKYILQQIKTGNYKRNSNSKKIQEVKDMISKDLAKFIFADKAYTDEELGRELQKMENKYNMWLNE